MAKRRALARALSGLGEGIGDASSYLFKMTQQERMQDRYDERQAKNAAAIADRTEAADVRRQIGEIRAKVASGDLEPGQAAAIEQRLIGKAVTPDSYNDLRPSPRRRIENTVGKRIMEEDDPSQMPGPSDIMSMFSAEGVEPMAPQLPPEFSDGMLPPNDPYAGTTDLVREQGIRATTRRRSMEDQPTERFEIENPDGSTSVQFGSKSGGPVTTKPTATQQGVIEGTKDLGRLGISGFAQAEQKGREAKAVFDVNNSPEAQAARIREAVNKEVATLRATMPLQLELAGKKAAAEIAQAVNKDNAQNVAAANRAAQELQPFFTKVTEITQSLNNREGIGSRVKGASKVAASYLGLAPEVNELKQLISQNLRQIAIAQGVREANVSQSETAQALDGIGLFAWTSATERRNALRNMHDLITLGPAVAARSSANATIGERMQLAQSLLQQRRSVEAKAIEMGADVYRDPVLGTYIPVIR